MDIFSWIDLAVKIEKFNSQIPNWGASDYMIAYRVLDMYSIMNQTTMNYIEKFKNNEKTV